METRGIKDKMLVTTIVIAFNRKNYLGDALNSLLKIHIPSDVDLEIIVVKNFSDPSTDHIITDNNFTEIRADNTPFGDYVILGLNASHGDWILILDDDDLFTEDKLIKLHKYMKDEKITVIHNNQTFVNYKLEATESPRWNMRKFSPIIFSYFNVISVRKFYKFHLWHNNSSYCIKRELLLRFEDKIRLFNMIDNIFPIISISSGKKFIAIPDRLTIQRQSKDSYKIKSNSPNGRLTEINEFKEIQSTLCNASTEVLIKPFLVSKLVEKVIKDGSNYNERLRILHETFMTWLITRRGLYLFLLLILITSLFSMSLSSYVYFFTLKINEP